MPRMQRISAWERHRRAGFAVQSLPVVKAEHIRAAADESHPIVGVHRATQAGIFVPRIQSLRLLRGVFDAYLLCVLIKCDPIEFGAARKPQCVIYILPADLAPEMTFKLVLDLSPKLAPELAPEMVPEMAPELDPELIL